MKTHVEFRSSKFPPYEGEEDDINPDRFGRRVAEYLAEKLKAEGIATGEILCEDWGVVLPVVNEGFRLWIGVGNYGEGDDGFLCFIEPHTPTIRKWFKRIDTTPSVVPLQRAMEKILESDPDIHDVKWWTYDEFNRPCG
jgi:hypothetical protein